MASKAAHVSDDPISAAITETEKEIAAGAWDIEEHTLDDTGDRSLEQMGEGLEGQHEPGDTANAKPDAGDGEDGKTGDADDGGDEAETDTGADDVSDTGDGEAAAQPEPEADRRGRVPPGVHREVKDKLRATEQQLAERDQAHKREIEALNAKFDGVLAALKTQGQPKPQDSEANQPKPDDLPDIFEDPNGFIEALDKRQERKLGTLGEQLGTMRVEFSMGLAHARYGDAFNGALQSLQRLDPQNPEDRSTVQRIYGSSNPGEALVAWHKRNETLARVGDDPDAFEKSIEQRTREALMKDPEFRKQLIADLQAEAGTANNGRGNTITRLPPSSRNRGNAGNMADNFGHDGSEQAIANAAWND